MLRNYRPTQHKAAGMKIDSRHITAAMVNSPICHRVLERGGILRLKGGTKMSTMMCWSISGRSSTAILITINHYYRMY